ncbi:MAG: HK97 gp10 family phage protein [Clostridia bacterium]|nr:HK97 gp10 family phage protein [Clostridia bacterium]
MIDVKVETHADLFKDAVKEAVEAALEAVGLQAEGYAKANITAAGRVDTGELRNSVTHQVEESEQAVYIGSNLEYAIYNEVGTGIYAEGGGGRKDPWMYVDDNGVGHWTVGITPIHFLKDAAADHGDEYRQIAEAVMKEWQV